MMVLVIKIRDCMLMVNILNGEVKQYNQKRLTREQYDSFLKGEREDIGYISSMIRKWSSGKLGPNVSYELFWLLDDWLDLDCMFILFDIPNYSISGDQRIKLEELIINYGSRHVREKYDPNKAYALVLEKYYSHNDY